jgi:bacillithiol system protein YtxJ
MEVVGRETDFSGDADGVRSVRPRPRVCNLKEWSRLLKASEAQPILIFKHSTICGISFTVLQEVEEFLASRGTTVPMSVVQVIEDRNLSDVIAKQTGISHKSPQLILIRNQSPIWHASHWSIDFKELDGILSEHGSPSHTQSPF